MKILGKEYRKIDLENEFNFYQEELAAKLIGDLANYQGSLKSSEPGDVVKELYNVGLIPRALAIIYIPKDWEYFDPDGDESYEERVKKFKLLPKKEREEAESDLENFFDFATKSITAGFQIFSKQANKPKQTQES